MLTLWLSRVLRDRTCLSQCQSRQELSLDLIPANIVILEKVLCVPFQFDTSVVSCCPAELKQEVNGKKETLKGFNVKLQDTILFPEGGGQVR